MSGYDIIPVAEALDLDDLSVVSWLSDDSQAEISLVAVGLPPLSPREALDDLLGQCGLPEEREEILGGSFVLLPEEEEQDPPYRPGPGRAVVWGPRGLDPAEGRLLLGWVEVPSGTSTEDLMEDGPSLPDGLAVRALALDEILDLVEGGLLPGPEGEGWIPLPED